jgi:hypothetical protein
VAWQGPYYYRSVRDNGRPRRQYVGRGELAQLTAELDGLALQAKELAREESRAEKARLRDLDTAVARLDEAADLLAKGRPVGGRVPPAQPRRVEEAT